MKPLGLPDPRRIGPYRIFALLGRGGMGRVYLAGAPDGRLVALKLVHVQHLEEPGFRERFRREVAASRRVSGAYTAPVMDADVETDVPWLVTVFVPGPSLREAIEAAGPLPPVTAARLAAGLATALGEIHAAGLVHRDLKPSNVLLASDGPRVIDFGVARTTDGHTSELTHTGWLVGSPGYMSPEQAESKALTPASDVFSLGAVVYMACTGTEPFMGASTPATLYNVVHAEPDLEAVPEQLRGVIAACLAKDPAARPTPEQVLTLIGDVPAVTRTWPDAVHALIAEQENAVVEALRDGGASPDVAVVPLLPGDPRSDTGQHAIADTGQHSIAQTGQHSIAETGRHAVDRRPRRALTVVLAAAALAVGGTAAAVVGVGSGGSTPTAANPPVSSSADSVPDVPTGSQTSESAAPSEPAPAHSDSESTPATSTRTTGSTTGASTTPKPSDTPISMSPPCLSNAEAKTLAKEKNRGTLPDDAVITVLKCDDGWAGARMTSASVGDGWAVYEYDGAAWTGVDLGPVVCTGVVRGAPADVRKAIDC